jgi:EAL domain-containing protein (putative c-di-GMP-specific phosphodiesterase class I)
MDRAFLTKEHEDSGLAGAIIAMGNSLNLEVVAEGIEFPEQIGSLRDLGCELGQGFLFAKPMSRDDLVEYLDLGLDEVAGSAA